MIDASTTEKWARERLDEERLQHTQGVVKMAVMLAHRYGVEEEKARIAAWGHDLFRRENYEKLCCMCREWGMKRPENYPTTGLLHGPAAAAFFISKGMVDREILDAIHYHTVGRDGMGPLEQILFVADKCEESRNYPGVEELRALAEVDLAGTVEEIRENSRKRHGDKPS